MHDKLEAALARTLLVRYLNAFLAINVLYALDGRLGILDNRLRDRPLRDLIIRRQLGQHQR
jgi:hypothetical protein